MDNARKIIEKLTIADEDSLYDIGFSSMAEYLHAVSTEAKAESVQFEVAKKDFWRYNWINAKNAFWTGYFSTYPVIKREIMHYSDFVQSSTTFLSLFD